jgi:excinuclease ABC subunit A
MSSRQNHQTSINSVNGINGVNSTIRVRGATEHNLKNIDLDIRRGAITVITGVSGSGKSSLAFDTVLAESQRRFFYTLSHYSRQFLDLGTRPAVKQVTGLSPAIALAQNETAPSRRATLGSLTDLSELLAVMYARFGELLCPKHRRATTAMTKDEILRHILAAAEGKNIALVIPMAESKKGIFRKELTAFAAKGYTKAWIDGKVTDLEPVPELAREEKHTIKVLVDLLKVKKDAPERLIRGIQAVLDQAGGYGEWVYVDSKGHWDTQHKVVFSTNGGCPECGYSWPKLDSRYFNANSLGRCDDCDGYGVLDVEDAEENGEDEHDAVALSETRCDTCLGTGVQKDADAILLAGKTIHELLNLQLTGLLRQLQDQSWLNRFKDNPAFERVASEVRDGVQRLVAMNLGYLSLARRVRSLSGGESQRVKLAGILSENLRGILYVLDEPSQGLHHSELATMIKHLKDLRDQGNTVIIVDHDEDIMNCADQIVDLGPTGGRDGGHLLATFTPADAAKFTKISKTAQWLARAKTTPRRRPIDHAKQTFLTVKQPRLNNLKMAQVRVPLEAMTVVTGVSGAGKSSLVLGVLFPNLITAMTLDGKKSKANHWAHCAGFDGHEGIKRVDLIDRRPVAKSSVSMPATYLDVLGDLRDLYASLPDAQVAGLTAKAFSIHLEGGRCPECKGRGELNLQMRFLADARIRCPVCGGKRFRSHVLDVKFNGLSIYDVLNLSVDEAMTQFNHHRKIIQKLAPAQRLGLGYLKLGQPSASLSGGEAQRLKMVPYFTRKMGQGSVLILDEPTTGLHFEDVSRLVAVMRELTDLGVTLIVVEHNDEVIRAADWSLNIGPGAAAEGGTLTYEGVPRERLEA